MGREEGWSEGVIGGGGWRGKGGRDRGGGSGVAERSPCRVQRVQSTFTYDP